MTRLFLVIVAVMRHVYSYMACFNSKPDLFPTLSFEMTCSLRREIGYRDNLMLYDVLEIILSNLNIDKKNQMSLKSLYRNCEIF